METGDGEEQAKEPAALASTGGSVGCAVNSEICNPALHLVCSGAYNRTPSVGLVFVCQSESPADLLQEVAEEPTDSASSGRHASVSHFFV